MNFKEIIMPTKRKIIKFIISFSVIMLFTIGIRFTGGPNYIFAPFPIKMTYCRFDIGCTSSILWGGIIISIIFWFGIYFAISHVEYNKKK